MNPKNIPLKRYADGTPSVMRKKTVYTELHFYKKSYVLVQLTNVSSCLCYILCRKRPCKKQSFAKTKKT